MFTEAIQLFFCWPVSLVQLFCSTENAYNRFAKSLNHSASILSWINLVALWQCRQASVSCLHSFFIPSLMCLEFSLEEEDNRKRLKSLKLWIDSINESFQKLSWSRKENHLHGKHISQRKIDLSQKIKLSPQIIVFIWYGKKIVFSETRKNSKPKLDQRGRNTERWGATLGT